MPRRITVPTFGNEFPSQPYVRQPDGRRVLIADIEAARDAMAFGGDTGVPRDSVPWTMPQRAGDNSNAGLVNRNLFRQDNQANTDFWVAPRENPNRPHQAIDVRTSPNASVNAGATVPQYNPTPEPRETFDARNAYGEPTVQISRENAPFGSAGNLDDEPSLFPEPDQWWKEFDPTFVTGNGDISAGVSSNDGGTIWEGNMGEFGGDTSLGNDLNASLDSLDYGQDYPAQESAPSPTPVDDTIFPVEPDVLPQDQDIEWTTSPDDRRFLPEAPSVNRGGDISSFGTFGSPLTLGQYLYTPLSTMRYGEGYPVGHVFSAGTEDSTGTTYIDQGEGLTDEQLAERHRQEVEGSIPTGRAVTPEVRRGELVSGPQNQMNTILQQFPSLNNPAGIRALTSGANPNDLIGRTQFDSHAGNLFLMATQAFGGQPNRRLAGEEDLVGNAGRSRQGFMGNSTARLNAIQAAGGGLTTNPNEADAWNRRAASSWASRGSGVRGLPQSAGSGVGGRG